MSVVKKDMAGLLTLEQAAAGRERYDVTAMPTPAVRLSELLARFREFAY